MFVKFTDHFMEQKLRIDIGVGREGGVIICPCIEHVVLLEENLSSILENLL